MAKKNNAAPPAPSQSFGLTIAAALALTNEEAADEFAHRANVRRLCFQDQGKLIHSMTSRGLAPGETVYSILRARGVNENSIQNAKRAADVIGELVGAELVTEAELDAVLTHRFAVDYMKCVKSKVPPESIAAIIKLPNAAAEIECLAANGKTLSQMEAETAAKVAAEKAAKEQAAAQEQADAEAAAAAAAEQAAAAEKAAKDKAAAEKQAAANAAKEKELAEKNAAVDKKSAAAKAAAEKAATDAAAAKESAEKAAADKAAAEKQALENAAKEKELAEKNAAAEKRLEELAAAEAKAAAAPPPPAPVETPAAAATKAAAKELQSSREAKLPTPAEILQNLTNALAACFNLPAADLAMVPNMLAAASDDIKSHLTQKKAKAA
ncbi:hypothetical protein UFOVP736_79 [uncultured Caudovirales phage]|uniref:Uncharacterized protein n=1 Tax=uncultured Caudovirales phage TaxID=2100421 RepID=A0A6J7XAT9_9CAUD|nr:hypothetical protein UFOVP705_2 [uncultured Caudovirales phage]CAB5224438.1 hypothetical protein UFOVP736_79 [uncultured Caudovirales phage]